MRNSAVSLTEMSTMPFSLSCIYLLKVNNEMIKTMSENFSVFDV